MEEAAAGDRGSPAGPRAGAPQALRSRGATIPARALVVVWHHVQRETLRLLRLRRTQGDHPCRMVNPPELTWHAGRCSARDPACGCWRILQRRMSASLLEGSLLESARLLEIWRPGGRFFSFPLHSEISNLQLSYVCPPASVLIASMFSSRVRTTLQRCRRATI